MLDYLLAVVGLALIICGMGMAIENKPDRTDDSWDEVIACGIVLVGIVLACVGFDGALP